MRFSTLEKRPVRGSGLPRPSLRSPIGPQPIRVKVLKASTTLLGTMVSKCENFSWPCHGCNQPSRPPTGEEEVSVTRDSTMVSPTDCSPIKEEPKRIPMELRAGSGLEPCPGRCWEVILRPRWDNTQLVSQEYLPTDARELKRRFLKRRSTISASW
jgi:hypothetical protein